MCSPIPTYSGATVWPRSSPLPAGALPPSSGTSYHAVQDVCRDCPLLTGDLTSGSAGPSPALLGVRASEQLSLHPGQGPPTRPCMGCAAVTAPLAAAGPRSHSLGAKQSSKLCYSGLTQQRAVEEPSAGRTALPLGLGPCQTPRWHLSPPAFLSLPPQTSSCSFLRTEDTSLWVSRDCLQHTGASRGLPT